MAAATAPRVLLVTLAIGEKYSTLYNQLFRRSHEAYAARHAYDFRVVTEFLDPDNCHPGLITMQKFLVAGQPWSAEYEYVVFIDADTILSDTAPPIHLATPFGDCVGMVDEYSQPTRAERLERHRQAGWELTGKEFYALCEIDYDSEIVLNSGLIVLQPAKHAALMQEIYDTYFQRQMHHPRGAIYEQTVLGYELLRREKVVLLPPTWNSLWNFYKKDEMIESLERHIDTHAMTHFAGWVDFEKVAVLSARDAASAIIYQGR